MNTFQTIYKKIAEGLHDIVETPYRSDEYIENVLKEVLSIPSSDKDIALLLTYKVHDLHEAYFKEINFTDIPTRNLIQTLNNYVIDNYKSLSSFVNDLWEPDYVPYNWAVLCAGYGYSIEQWNTNPSA